MLASSSNPSIRALGAASVVFSHASSRVNAKVTDLNQETIVYCGPDISCDPIKHVAKSNGVKLSQNGKIVISTID